ncbi:MAG TPA: PH domain-containing protein [Acidimicrobiales bacterium]|nr:PH domain-containing protein [Acidimicrobiales bacterium]
MKQLAPGETVVVEVRPHWWYLAGPITVLAAVIAGGITALVEHVPGWVDWIVVAVLVLAALWMIGRYLRWVTTRLVVTSTRIIDRRGILGRSAREIPLSAVTDIGYHQSIFERVIGAGDVLIESAGRDGQEVFPDLPHPGAIHNEIYAQMQRNRTGAPAPASIPEQIDQLDQLRRRGVLTDAEFEAKKADLLGRL